MGVLINEKIIKEEAIEVRIRLYDLLNIPEEERTFDMLKERKTRRPDDH